MNNIRLVTWIVFVFVFLQTINNYFTNHNLKNFTIPTFVDKLSTKPAGKAKDENAVEVTINSKIIKTTQGLAPKYELYNSRIQIRQPLIPDDHYFTMR